LEGIFEKKIKIFKIEMKTLIINNSPYICSVIRSVLAELGHKDVDEYTGNLTVEDTLKHGEYDLLICDSMALHNNIFSLLDYIRGDRDLRCMRVLILQEFFGKSLILKIFEVQGNTYLVKPFTPSQLREKLRALLDISV
jgi:two-component system, chemotaxis family, chemotaxis protein CheY